MKKLLSFLLICFSLSAFSLSAFSQSSKADSIDHKLFFFSDSTATLVFSGSTQSRTVTFDTVKVVMITADTCFPAGIVIWTFGYKVTEVHAPYYPNGMEFYSVYRNSATVQYLDHNRQPLSGTVLVLLSREVEASKIPDLILHGL